MKALIGNRTHGLRRTVVVMPCGYGAEEVYEELALTKCSSSSSSRWGHFIL